MHITILGGNTINISDLAYDSTYYIKVTDVNGCVARTTINTERPISCTNTI